MTAECNQLDFGCHPQKRREIRARFDGGAIASDGGASSIKLPQKSFPQTRY